MAKRQPLRDVLNVNVPSATASVTKADVTTDTEKEKPKAK